MAKGAGATAAPDASIVGCGDAYSEEQQRAVGVFKYLLVFVAALESFAHGANDTANATGACGSSACRRA